MPTDKPQIAILMAVYEPRMDWLREQLLSLNAQTYPNLKLYVRDDCSPSVPYEEIQSCLQDCISAFPYTIQRNEKNLGSNGTFEQLTREAEGDYFAYCDQDDIWLPEKLSVLYETACQSRALLVCSDMNIIDGEGTLVADSIRKVRRHHIFKSGNGLSKGLIISNFVTGCTMLVRAEMARAAIPFCPYMVHDHYIALYCSLRGSIESMPEQLINYRIHGENQTQMMAGVKSKATYLSIRIDTLIERLTWLRDRFENLGEFGDEVESALIWALNRKENFNRFSFSCKRKLFEYKRFSPLTTLFELVMSDAPEWLFMKFIKMKKKNII